MDDVRTLANQRRRRRLARHTVSQLCLRRSFAAGAAAFVELGAAAEEAFDSATDAVYTFEVQRMWEQA